MNYIFCGASNALIFTLYLKNVLNEKITIVTYNKNIIKYCNDENINYIQYERIRPTSPSFTTLKELITLKKVLDTVIKKINLNKEDCFFLTGNNALAYDSFYLAKELSKNGVCYYKYIDKLFKIYKPKKFKPIFIRGEIMRVLLKIILDLDIIFYETNKVPRFGVDDTFQKKFNITEYVPHISFKELCVDVIKKTKSSYKEFDNLIIDSGPVEEVVEIDSIKKFYKKLFKLPLKFAFKQHPDVLRSETKFTLSFYEIFKECKELPSYMPVQLFGNNIKKNVLSLFSASLINVSQLQHLTAISILELVDWHHESYKKEWKNHLKKASNNRILFPSTFEELKEILLR